MFVRWLLPLVAVFTLLGNAVTAFAASGIVDETACCCPDPATCACHDHDGDPKPDDVMQRCGGTAQVVTPQLVTAFVPTAPVLAAIRVIAIAMHGILPVPAERTIVPETPPF